jgi:hypothetical protein
MNNTMNIRTPALMVSGGYSEPGDKIMLYRFRPSSAVSGMTR